MTIKDYLSELLSQQTQVDSFEQWDVLEAQITELKLKVQ